MQLHRCSSNRPLTCCVFRTLAASSLLLSLSLCHGLLAQPDVPPPGPAPAEAPPADQPGLETLTQGPIHEAFANPADMDPTPGPVAPKQPPADVPEDPPEFMPEGAIWIPGYWIWDDDRDDFIWVTGVARVPPPGMRWVPGYFTQVDGGWQRVSGFWIGNDIAEVDYRVSAPPATLETGPSSPAPANNYFWIPGSWAYYDTGYRWHAGYWTPYRPNWIWIPARWAWTPGGFVYIPGFWDYQLAYRGQMFAPVYFTSPVYARPGWSYRPWCVIPTSNLFIHLWIRPRWGSYYFGNYYGAQFASRGFVPWANLTVVAGPRPIYDPFYSYARVHYRQQGVDYLGRVQGWHRYYAEHADLRPARTWHEQQRVVNRAAGPAADTQLVARNITEVARRNDAPIRLTRLDDQAQKIQKQHADQLREFHSERSRVEKSASQTAGRLPARSETPAESRIAADRGDKESKAGRDAGEHPGRQGAKLALPKSDLSTAAGGVARTQAGGPDRPGGPGASVPPPKPTPTSQTADEGRPRRGDGDRPTGGPGKTAKTKGPPAADEPRSPTIDLPPGSGTLPGSGRNQGISRGNDLPRVSPPGKAGDVPRVNSSGRENPLTKSARPDTGTPNVAPPNPLPDTSPSGRRTTPKVAPGGGSPNVLPRNNLPAERGGGDVSRGGQRGDTVPNRGETPRPTFGRDASPLPRADARPMPRIEAPRTAPNIDRSTPSGDASKSGGRGKSKGRDGN